MQHWHIAIIWFVAGVFVGSNIAVVVMCIMRVAGRRT